MNIIYSLPMVIRYSHYGEKRALSESVIRAYGTFMMKNWTTWRKKKGGKWSTKKGIVFNGLYHEQDTFHYNLKNSRQNCCILCLFKRGDFVRLVIYLIFEWIVKSCKGSTTGSRSELGKKSPKIDVWLSLDVYQPHPFPNKNITVRIINLYCGHQLHELIVSLMGRLEGWKGASKFYFCIQALIFKDHREQREKRKEMPFVDFCNVYNGAL